MFCRTATIKHNGDTDEMNQPCHNRNMYPNEQSLQQDTFNSQRPSV